MRRVYAKPVPLSKTERQRLRKLETRYDALRDKYPHGDVPAGDAEKLGRIEAAIEALRREEYKARDLALAGAFATLAGDGSVRVERGFVRAEDEPESKTKAKDQKNLTAKDADGLAPLSEKLVAELTAYRTSALRNELAQHPATALIALVHTLALANHLAQGLQRRGGPFFLNQQHRVALARRIVHRDDQVQRRQTFAGAQFAEWAVMDWKSFQRPNAIIPLR
jgi:hypothetical protein